MSSFNGKIRQYPWISIDRFDGDNFKAAGYFLTCVVVCRNISIHQQSHAHMDHMVGLESPHLCERLKNERIAIYVSELTKHVLFYDERYSEICKYTLTVHPTRYIHVQDPKTHERVFVKCIKASHCPGSYMCSILCSNCATFFFSRFLLDGARGKVVYTGDFRLTNDEIKALLPKGPIECVYLDTTFCTLKSYYICTRQQSVDEMIRLIDAHRMQRGNAAKVLLYLTTSFGHEDIIRMLSLHYRQPAHVNYKKCEVLTKMFTMRTALTTQSEDTWLHACLGWDAREAIVDVFNTTNEALNRRVLHKNPCASVPIDDENVLVIKPCMMYFAESDKPEISQWFGANKVRVQYSTHASLSEARCLVEHCQPKQLYANVVPVGARDKVAALEPFEDLVPADGLMLDNDISLADYRSRRNARCHERKRSILTVVDVEDEEPADKKLMSANAELRRGKQAQDLKSKQDDDDDVIVLN